MPFSKTATMDEQRLAQIMSKARVLVETGFFDEAYYRENNAMPPGLDLFEHFFLTGYKEGRRPNAVFDPLWYLSAYPEVAASGFNPLLEYALVGEREGRNPSPQFDVRWYRKNYRLDDKTSPMLHYLQNFTGPFSPIPEFDAEYYLAANSDVAAAQMNAFEHYLHTGFKEGRSPSPRFNANAYARRMLRNEKDVNPIVHFRANRDSNDAQPFLNGEEQTPFSAVKKFSQPGPDFAKRIPLAAETPRRAKILAYYLTQFHAIAENDEWWGDGFTEWTNIARGQPRFPDHYQPRVPRDLGFYNLEDVGVMRKQAAMARDAGIFGFIFYYYWFDGKRLLEKPLENFLATPDVEMPFCLMWANENWTRRWDGAEQEILIAQKYGADDDEGICADFARHFKDPRYIRIDGRPLLMVYRPSLIDNTATAIAHWRKIFRDTFDEDPILVMAQCFLDFDPRPFGFDGAIEFPPHKLTRHMDNRNPDIEFFDADFKGNVFDYEQVVTASLDNEPPEFPLIKTIVPSWDNDARRQGAGMALRGSTPGKYEKWLSELVERARHHPFFGEPIVCVNAWNEWAEGAYLEPDLHHGSAYLNATARAVSGASRTGQRLLLVGHDAFPSGAQHLLLNIGRSLKSLFGLEIEFILLDEGAMADAYAATAPLTIVSSLKHLKDIVAEKKAKGFGSAIVNTIASGDAVPVLADAGLHVVLLVHEMPGIVEEKALQASARRGLEKADCVIFPADCVKALLLDALSVAADDRMIVRPQGSYKTLQRRPQNAARLRAEMGIAEDAPMVLGAGYADLRKGFDLFLRNWGEFRALNMLVHFCWIGNIDQGLAAQLEDKIAAARRTGTFHMPGFIADPDDFYLASDVFLLASREDPFPTVALEALSLGIPVVAFANTGGVPELLVRELLGFVAPLGDMRALCERIEQACALAADPKFIERAQDAVATKFSFETYAADLFRFAMPQTAKISVVVPNYNYAHCLTERLNSICDQDHPVWEIIVLDDASTDNSFDVVHDVARARDRDLTLVINERNSGSVFKQWAQAAQAATGDFIWIAEADDLSAPSFLSKMLAVMAIDPDIAFGFSDSRSIDGTGAPIGDSYKPYYDTVEPNALTVDQTFAGSDFITRYLSVKNLILNVSSVLWRREALALSLKSCQEELGQFKMAGDWRLYVECLSAPRARVAYVAETLNIHRRHAQSVTHALKAEKHVTEIALMQNIVRRNGMLTQLVADAQSAYLAEVTKQLTGAVDAGAAISEAEPGFFKLKSSTATHSPDKKGL